MIDFKSRLKNAIRPIISDMMDECLTEVVSEIINGSETAGASVALATAQAPAPAPFAHAVPVAQPAPAAPAATSTGRPRGRPRKARDNGDGAAPTSGPDDDAAGMDPVDADDAAEEEIKRLEGETVDRHPGPAEGVASTEGANLADRMAAVDAENEVAAARVRQANAELAADIAATQRAETLSAFKPVAQEPAPAAPAAPAPAAPAGAVVTLAMLHQLMRQKDTYRQVASDAMVEQGIPTLKDLPDNHPHLLVVWNALSAHRIAEM